MLKAYAHTAIGDLHYCRVGEGDPIVLLPPSGRSCMIYANLMQALAEEYLVIGLDPPGCGRSDRLPSGATIRDIAVSLDEALEDLRLLRANVFGLHNGNKLATALAIHSASRVRKLVIAGLSHSLIPDPVLRHKSIEKYIAGSLAISDATKDQAGILKAWIAQYSEVSSLWFDDAAMANMTSVEASSDRLEVLIDHMQGMASKPHLFKANLAYEFEKDLPLLAVPTLVLEIVTPEEDELLGRQGSKLQAIIQDCQWITLDEPELSRHEFEHRAGDIAPILQQFFSSRAQVSQNVISSTALPERPSSKRPKP
jgi:pimeloyl-ACP methyl ester carboxylesterase